MRIVGGRFRGRALQAPSDRAIRPTADRLRETLFNILTHWQGEDRVRDARVIDLFAGTGALGLEALSRGARHALFVDDGAEARALLRANVEALGVAGLTRIFRRDATKLGAAATDPFDLAFLDPPYGRHLADAALGGLVAGGWLAPGALVVVEEAAGSDISMPAVLTEVQRRPSRDSQLIIYAFGTAVAASNTPGAGPAEMTIRAEGAADAAAIRSLTEAAFAGVKHSSQTEGAIVDALRQAGVLTLSLVAERDHEIIGHAAFSSVLIDGKERDWFGLGPVSVLPGLQRTGIGTALIREGLRQLDRRGAQGCVVLGDPAFYGRFGFTSDHGLRYGTVSARYFQSLRLSGDPISGEVTYHEGFAARP